MSVRCTTRWPTHGSGKPGIGSSRFVTSTRAGSIRKARIASEARLADASPAINTVGGSCGAAGANDNGAKQWNIGYDYRFSKRTTVGIGYAMIDNDPAAIFTWSGLSSSQGGQSINPPAGSDVSIFFVSMIHRF